MIRPPGDLEMTWLIARRAALEALQDRMTLIMGLGIAVVLPAFLLLVGVRPVLSQPDGMESLTGALAFYVLLVGLVPTASAVGIAAGQFAGEKERGVLTPLLASPASNMAIFAGKVLGAVLPAIMYALLGDAIFLAGLIVLVGANGLQQIPLALAATMVLLVPEVACFAATIASLISSRVRTFNSAQQIAGLVLMPLWGVVFTLSVKVQELGGLAIAGTLLLVLAVDVLLATLAARTWRREEALSQR